MNDASSKTTAASPAESQERVRSAVKRFLRLHKALSSSAARALDGSLLTPALAGVALELSESELGERVARGDEVLRRRGVILALTRTPVRFGLGACCEPDAAVLLPGVQALREELRQRGLRRPGAQANLAWLALARGHRASSLSSEPGAPPEIAGERIDRLAALARAVAMKSGNDHRMGPLAVAADLGEDPVAFGMRVARIAPLVPSRSGGTPEGRHLGPVLAALESAVHGIERDEVLAAFTARVEALEAAFPRVARCDLLPLAALTVEDPASLLAEALDGVAGGALGSPAVCFGFASGLLRAALGSPGARRAVPLEALASQIAGVESQRTVMVAALVTLLGAATLGALGN